MYRIVFLLIIFFYPVMGFSIPSDLTFDTEPINDCHPPLSCTQNFDEFYDVEFECVDPSSVLLFPDLRDLNYNHDGLCRENLNLFQS